MNKGFNLIIFVLEQIEYQNTSVEGMEKIKLDIVGLSYSQTQSGAYALVLGESIGKEDFRLLLEVLKLKRLL